MCEMVPGLRTNPRRHAGKQDYPGKTFLGVSLRNIYALWLLVML